MKKILFLVFFSFTIMFGQDSTKIVRDSTKHTPVIIRNDGSWWKKFGSMDKIPYLTGIFDGLSLGTSMAVKDQNGICYQTGSSAENDFLNRLDTIKVGHMYEELERFYGDSLNTKVLFDDAFKYVVYRLSGYDSLNLNKLLEAYRKEEKEYKVR